MPNTKTRFKLDVMIKENAEKTKVSKININLIPESQKDPKKSSRPEASKELLERIIKKVERI